jgi:hypothetical protein
MACRGDSREHQPQAASGARLTDGADGRIAETVVCPPPTPSAVFGSGLLTELLKRWCVPTIPAARELKHTVQEIVDDIREHRPIGVWSVFL